MPNQTFPERLETLRLATGWLKTKDLAMNLGIRQAAVTIALGGGRFTVPLVRALRAMETRHADDISALNQGAIIIRRNKNGRVYQRLDMRFPVLRPEDLAQMADPLGARTLAESEAGVRRTPKIVYVPSRTRAKRWGYRPNGVGRREPDNPGESRTTEGISR